MTSQRDVVVLGSTGSVGTQAVKLVRRYPDRFRVVGLAAGGGNVALLAQQALELGVDVVAVARASVVQDLQLAFYADAQRRGYDRGQVRLPKVVGGPDAAAEVATWPCDVVLNAMTGSVGLAPTLAALDTGRTLALANKESLVAGGALVTERAKPGQIVPVDSEHSALAQCLRAGRAAEVRRLVLTASGGPFRGRSRAEMADVTYAEARAHPTWDMGPVITINSATLVNKGLEMIEAHLLFDVPYDDIEVVVHPQSLVHSMVEFSDGSTIAQASPPDMTLPISLALTWPDRLPGAATPFDWSSASTWEFQPFDHEAFPAIALCREAGLRGGTAPAALNAANEECVAAFTSGALPFLGIVDTLARVVDEHAREHGSSGARNTMGLADVLAAENWARTRTRELIGQATATGADQATGPAARGRRVTMNWLYVLGVAVFVIGLLVAIGLHEVGHMVPAKHFGVKVTQYMIGFGPTVWSRKKGDTEYGFKLIPLGGYIRMIGMFPPGKDGRVRESTTGPIRSMMDEARAVSLREVGPGDEDRVFYRKHWWQKVVVMSGGPFMNFVQAFVLFAIVLMGFGVATPTTTVSSVPACVLTIDQLETRVDPVTGVPECLPTDPESPAAEAGLQPGDEIVSVAGVPATDWEAVSSTIRAHGDETVEVVVTRDGETLTLSAPLITTDRPSVDDPEVLVPVGYLGISPSQELVQQPITAVPAQMWEFTKNTAIAIVSIPQRMVGVWQAAFGDEVRDPEGPIGIVGAGRIGGEFVASDSFATQEKVASMLALLASLNMALGIFNLLPLLPLDGGHIAGALYEAARRGVARLRHRPDPGYFDVAKLLPVAYGVAILVIGMSALLLYADIFNPVKLPL